MVTVTYRCPRCGAVAALERDGYLADKCVTAEPLDGWEYAPAYEACEGRSPSGCASGEGSEPRAFEDADGVELVCGATETRGEGCGRPYYLSFVRYDEGTEVDADVDRVDANFDFLR